jgi:spore coat protein A, manganese oxidase
VRMNPGEVTTVIMQFNAPDPAVVQPWVQFATSPRTGGYEYVWHCHILEHEEHDMMRNLVVKPGRRMRK